MKKVILDENLPIRLRHLLSEFDVVTVQYQGWSGVKNGELIRLIDGHFEVLITCDKNLRYQQNLSSRTITIIELPSNDRRSILNFLTRLKLAIKNASAGEYIQI